MRSQKNCSTQSTAVSGARTEEEKERENSGERGQIASTKLLELGFFSELYYRVYLRVCSNAVSGYDTASFKRKKARKKFQH